MTCPPFSGSGSASTPFGVSGACFLKFFSRMVPCFAPPFRLVFNRLPVPNWLHLNLSLPSSSPFQVHTVYSLPWITAVCCVSACTLSTSSSTWAGSPSGASWPYSSWAGRSGTTRTDSDGFRTNSDGFKTTAKLIQPFLRPIRTDSDGFTTHQNGFRRIQGHQNWFRSIQPEIFWRSSGRILRKKYSFKTKAIVLFKRQQDLLILTVTFSCCG